MTVIAGLAVSTALTLLVVPVVYDRLDALLAQVREPTAARAGAAVGDGSVAAGDLPALAAGDGGEG